MTDTTQQAAQETPAVADLPAADLSDAVGADADGPLDDTARRDDSTELAASVDSFLGDPRSLRKCLELLDMLKEIDQRKAAAAAKEAPAAPAAPPPSWVDGMIGDDRDFIVAKGWKSPADLLRSYRNVERMVGDRLPRPRGDDDTAGHERIYKALGRPDAPEDYRLPQVEGQDPAFSAEAAKWFHAAGLSRRQAAALAESWNAYILARGRDDGEGLSPAEARARIEALKQDKEWKARFLAGDRDEFTRWTRLHETAGAAHA